MKLSTVVAGALALPFVYGAPTGERSRGAQKTLLLTLRRYRYSPGASPEIWQDHVSDQDRFPARGLDKSYSR